MSALLAPPPAVALVRPLRVQHIALTDFRAFPGPTPVTFELAGKNLLVYGENGAGKSSLFYALQDFFALQPRRPLSEHQNVFSGLPLTDCKITVEFVDQLGAPAEWVAEKHPASLIRRLTASPIHGLPGSRDARVVDAARRTACLDYKSLLETNYSHGSDAINLFDLAVSSLLRDFRVTVEGGTESTISGLWSAVKRAEKNALVGTRSTRKEQKVRDACVAFNVALRSALDRLLPTANEVLQALGWNDVVLTHLTSPGVTYLTAHFRSARKLEGLSLTPEITYREKPLTRPQLFLNEARLSGLALALYLGGRLACVPAGESQALKLLVLDDVLVGVDHSNRLPVLNVLVDLFPEWQVVLLTHDKGWFDLARQKLPKAAWTCYEVYEGDALAPAPMPVVRQTLNRPAPALLQKARDLLALGYMEAAANYVRQAFETGIRAACELKSVKLSFKQDIADHKAQDFLKALRGWPGTATVSKPAWDASLHRLNLMKDVVMNPYSHPNAPNIPRQEIVEAIGAVDQFLALVRTR